MPSSFDTTLFPSLGRGITLTCYSLCFTSPMEMEPGPILIHGHSARKSQNNKIKLFLLMIPASSATHLTLICSAYTHLSLEEGMRSCKGNPFLCNFEKTSCLSHKPNSVAVFGMQVSAPPVSGLPF